MKIADFGLSQKLNDKNCGTLKVTSQQLPFKWMALESLLSATWSVETDVVSLPLYCILF